MAMRKTDEPNTLSLAEISEDSSPETESPVDSSEQAHLRLLPSMIVAEVDRSEQDSDEPSSPGFQ